jgi:hypothetical protein
VGRDSLLEVAGVSGRLWVAAPRPQELLDKQEDNTVTEQARELPIPPRALVAEDRFELVRVWIANRAPHVSVATGVWKDPAAWGILLADLARHVARAYEETKQMNQKEVLDRITTGLVAELTAATDKPTGRVVG